MDTRKFEAMIRIAEYENITKAAEIMGYSQSGVTQMLNSMEEELGIKLFERSKKGVTLSVDGTNILPLIYDIVDCQKRVEEEAMLLKGYETGKVVIASYESMAVSFLPEVIALFAADHPGIRVEVSGGMTKVGLIKMLKAHEVEIAFCKIGDEEGLESGMLIEDRYLVTMSSKNPLAKKKIISPDDFKDQSLIGYNIDGRLDIEEREVFEVEGTEKSNKYVSNLDEVLHNLVRCDLGIMMSSELMLTTRDMTGIVAKPLAEKAVRPLGYYVRSHDTLSRAASMFLEYVRNAAESKKRDRTSSDDRSL